MRSTKSGISPPTPIAAGAALAQRRSTGAEARRRLRGGAGGSLVPALSHCVRVRSVEARPARQAGSLPARFLGVTRHAVWLIDFGKGLIRR
jgi:hypothetical protein